MSFSREQEAAIDGMLKNAGWGPARTVEPLSGGANNRVFRLKPEGGPALLLKCYFRSESDPRDRFSVERTFYDLTQRAGIGAVPQAYDWNEQAGVALLELVEGERLQAGEVGEDHVGQAAEFYAALNDAEFRPQTTADLPEASDSCFSVHENIHAVERRISRLEKMEVADDVDREALDWIESTLKPHWQEVRDQYAGQVESLPKVPDFKTRIEPGCWGVSPSDFGFHNALLQSDGRLRFFDFEYAGWDDPAKTTADFFCQPAIPAPRRFLKRFVEIVAPSLSAPARERLDVWTPLLLPVHQVKWVCIILNIFLQADSQRRKFSRQDDLSDDVKSTQLSIAKSTLNRLD